MIKMMFQMQARVLWPVRIALSVSVCAVPLAFVARCVAAESAFAVSSVSIPVATATEKSTIKALQNQATRWVATGQKTVFKPLVGGKGVVVFEPQNASNVNSQWRNFGKGCTRWLHLHVSGQGELGTTPLWGTVNDARRDLKLPNLQLQSKNAAHLARFTGATHAVASTLQANGTHATLQLRVLDVQTQRVVGAPIQLRGTMSQMTSALPRVARDLSGRLGVKTNAPLASVTISGDEMAFLGKVPWKRYWEDLSREDELRLRTLNGKEPLAGVLWIYNGGRDEYQESFWHQVTGDMMRRHPNNTLVVSTIARRGVRFLKPYAAQMTALNKRYPQNYLVALAQSFWCSYQKQDDAQIQAAVRAVRISPRGDVAWLALENAFSNRAQNVRHSRFYAEMSPDEQQKVEQLYPNALLAALYTTQLNPTASKNWLRACMAATFNSDPSNAVLLWEAIRADPNLDENYKWGLQMFQPKWGGEQSDLRRLIAWMQTQPRIYPSLLVRIKSAMEMSDLGAEFPAVQKKAIADTESLVAGEPGSVAYRECLAVLYRNTQQYSKAKEQFEKWIGLQPDNVVPVITLADMYHSSMNDLNNAEKWYLQAQSMEPDNARTATALGNFYKDGKRNYSEAEKHYRRAIKLDSGYGEPVVGLANIYWFVKNDEKEGELLFQKAMTLSSKANAYTQYAWALLQHGQRDAALEYAKKARALGERSHPVFEALGLQ